MIRQYKPATSGEKEQCKQHTEAKMGVTTNTAQSRNTIQYQRKSLMSFVVKTNIRINGNKSTPARNKVAIETCMTMRIKGN